MVALLCDDLILHDEFQDASVMLQQVAFLSVHIQQVATLWGSMMDDGEDGVRNGMVIIVILVR
jgi:hypothetical protein